MGEKRKSRFGLGFLFGAVSGALAGVFFAPKSGKMMRREAKKKYKELVALLKEKEVDKRVEEIFGKVTDESKRIFLQVKEDLLVSLANLKERLEEIDEGRYMRAVENAVTNVKENFEDKKEKLERLKNYLADQWKKLNSKRQE
ncbi:YtxH domain-containing protein [Candidatus Roizmanbacteria bacterium]|nr:YtxH domain-containing protein [Candidatus Roizmanbacteria bacterium]